MTGADLLCDVLLANGIDTCFANPGTSEMHFVAALDRRPEMRCILGLAEGVVTGAADGYARMARKPAATLLHTGPGLANGLSNLHNARRARTPMINIVGDHASYHLGYDPPLASDIESLAGPMTDWLRRIDGPDNVAEATQAAVDAAMRLSGIATLILPADASWGTVSGPFRGQSAKADRPSADADTVLALSRRLSQLGTRAGLLVGQDAALGDGLAAAARISAATGARLLNEVFVARTQRGRGAPAARRIPYPIDQAREVLSGLELLLLVGAREPVAFFAYPGKPGRLLPDGCEIAVLADRDHDQVRSLHALARALGAEAPWPDMVAQGPQPPASNGPLTDEALSQLLAAHIPDRAIVVCEPLTSARGFERAATAAAPHDLIYCPSGGSIGAGLPTATGAAVAAADRKVICLQADGSGMYSLQALWTQARESLDVLTVIFANRKYAILEIEMANLGLGTPRRNAQRMMALDNPPLDWVALARGMGVEGRRAATVSELRDALVEGIARKGPFLVECLILADD